MISVEKSTKYRGHKIFLDIHTKEWRYVDNRTLVKSNWYLRNCGHCQKYTGSDGHDPCIGTLPGRVMNACCGHGNTKAAYIQLDNGRIISGEIAISAISNFALYKE